MKRKVEHYLKQTYGEHRARPDPADGHYSFCKLLKIIFAWPSLAERDIPLILQQIREKSKKPQKDKCQKNSNPGASKSANRGRPAKYLNESSFDEGDEEEDGEEENGQSETQHSNNSVLSESNENVHVSDGSNTSISLPSSSTNTTITTKGSIHIIFSFLIWGVAPRKRKPLDVTKLVPHIPNIAPVNVQVEPKVQIERKKFSTRGRKSSYSNIDDDMNTTLETSMEDQTTTKRVSYFLIIFLLIFVFSIEGTW